VTPRAFLFPLRRLPSKLHGDHPSPGPGDLLIFSMREPMRTSFLRKMAFPGHRPRGCLISASDVGWFKRRTWCAPSRIEHLSSLRRLSWPLAGRRGSFFPIASLHRGPPPDSPLKRSPCAPRYLDGTAPVLL